MALAPKLTAIHLQLTRACNLRCSMCGQWGENGYMFEHAREGELTRDDFFRLGRELDPNAVSVTLWGGEPFVFKHCLDVAREYRRLGFRQSIVTNGTLLEKVAGEIGGLFSTVFVSVDGTRNIHDEVRGVKGTFERVERGIRALRAAHPEQSIVIKTTLVRQNLDDLEALAPLLRSWKVNAWSLSPQMFLSSESAPAYTAYWKGFGVEKVTSASWADAFPPDFGRRVERCYRGLQERFADLRLSLASPGVQPEALVEWYDSPHKDLVRHHCYAPSRRLSIQSTGETSFCLDMTDGTFGNVKTQSPLSIFHSAQAERYRADVAANRNPACLRCVWKGNDFDVKG